MGFGGGIWACFHVSWKGRLFMGIKPVLGGALFLIVLPPWVIAGQGASLISQKYFGNAAEIQMIAVQEIADAQKFR